MFCFNCGTKNKDGAVFCFSCGTKLKLDDEPAAPVAAAVPAASEEPVAPEIPEPAAEEQKENSIRDEFYPGMMFDSEIMRFDKAPEVPAPVEEELPEIELPIAPAEPELAVPEIPVEESIVESTAPSVAEPTIVYAPQEDEINLDKTIIYETKAEKQAAREAVQAQNIQILPEPEVAPEQVPVQSVSELKDDSYNVYSGAVKGVTSFSFRENATPNSGEFAPPSPVMPQPVQVSALPVEAVPEAQYQQPVYQPMPAAVPYQPEASVQAPPPEKNNEKSAKKTSTSNKIIIIICSFVITISIALTAYLCISNDFGFSDFLESIGLSQQKDDDEDENENEDTDESRDDNENEDK